MKKLLSFKRFKFYLIVGSFFIMIWMFSALVQHPEQFVSRTINELWRALYLVPVVYFFYEYTIDYISRKRIIRSFFLLVFQLFLFSTGMYIWRSLGIALHIHTVYKIYESREHAVSDLFGNSVFAIVFFRMCIVVV